MTSRRICAAMLAAAFIPSLPYTVLAQEATTEAAASSAATPIDFSAIVARTAPAVVAISTRRLVVPELPPGFPSSLLEGVHEDPALQEAEAMGSGFLVSKEGHIVTNHHVVADASAIEVVLDDGSRHPATPVGTDPLTDLAVLKIDIDPAAADDLVIASWGDSRALQPGAWTIAVGSPFGLGGTVTVGVLSARQRDIQAGPYDNFLQTDASINVGNSGGPLFNVEGEVVGVNTAIFSPTGASVGIGFAVPSRTAERVVRQLIEEGTIQRGFIGVSLQDMDEAIARAFGYDSPNGALIASVDPDGPAAAAGLRPGDLVVRLDSRTIQSSHDLSLAIAELPPETDVRLHFIRRGTEQQANVILGLRETEAASLPLAAEEPADEGELHLGLSLTPLPDVVRRELGLGAQGVIVQAAEAGSLAAASGLQQGDLILEADHAPVADPEDVNHAWAGARDAERPLLLQIRRGPSALFVAVEG